MNIWFNNSYRKETTMKAHNVQGLIDVLHWMSIHDFLL